MCICIHIHIHKLEMRWGFNWDHAILNFRAAPLSEAGRMEIVWSVVHPNLTFRVILHGHDNWHLCTQNRSR